MEIYFEIRHDIKSDEDRVYARVSCGTAPPLEFELQGVFGAGPTTAVLNGLIADVNESAPTVTTAPPTCQTDPASA